MRNISKIQKRKEGGFVLTSELVLIVTILVIGMTVGLVTMRDAITGEMHDVAEAIGALDQSYAFDGITNAQLTASIAGSSFLDAADPLAGDGITWSYNAAPTPGEDGTADGGAIGTGDISAATVETP